MFGAPPLIDPEKARNSLEIRESSDIDTLLHPRVVEGAIGAVRGMIETLGLFAVTEPTPMDVAGLDGRSRVVALTAQGRTQHATVIAAGDGCFFVFGLFAATDGSRLLPDDLTAVSSAIKIEKYEPPMPPAPPPKDWSFDAFRRALGLDQANGKQ